MNTIILLILLSIGIEIMSLIWFFTDPRSIKDRLSYYTQPKSLLFYLLIITMLFLQIINILFFPNLSLPNNQLVFIVGLSFYSFGIILATWAKLTMKSNWGTPAQHNFKRQNELVTKGPFRLTRNPIYLGDISISFGYFLALRSYLIFFTLFILQYFYLSALKEEKLLEKYFGNKYLKYKQKTRRFI